MTILSQAETIRDETALGANTATRVGTCLVDIADAILALQTAKSVGNIFMVDNATVTVVSNTTDFFKISGTMTDRDEINNNFEKSSPTDNSLTYTGTTTKKFKVFAICTILCDHGSHTVEIGLYNSALAAVDSDTVGRTMIQAGANKPTQICCECLVSLSTDDYIEVHLRGVDSAESYVVTNLNLMITEL